MIKIYCELLLIFSIINVVLTTKDIFYIILHFNSKQMKLYSISYLIYIKGEKRLMSCMTIVERELLYNINDKICTYNIVFLNVRIVQIPTQIL